MVGIDGGGSYSRAVCTDLDGRILAMAKGSGTSPSHNTDACGNTQAVIRDVLAGANAAESEVLILAAGLAGLDAPGDLEWASRNTVLAGGAGRSLLVNDSHVALAGALVLKPGVLSVAGTGTITTALLEDGKYVTNYGFGHYSRSGAQHVGRYAVFELLLSTPSGQDSPWMERVLHHFEVSDLKQLHSLAAGGLGRSRVDSNRMYANLAPAVTAAAQAGSPIARNVCDRIAKEIVAAILLVADCFESESVSVALTGGVLCSDYVQANVTQALTAWTRKDLEIVDSALPPAAGAVLLALKEVGVPITETTLENLKGARDLYPRPDDSL